MTATATRRAGITDRYAREFAVSARRYEQARGLFPSGVTHDMRYLEPFPVYIDRAKGAHKWDVDGHELIDYWCGHGSLLLGHCPDELIAAVREHAPKTPVVVMAGATALADSHERDPEPIEDYVNAVCLKPFRAKDVIETVRDLMAA